MRIRLRRIGEEYGVLLPKRVIERLGLAKNDVLNLTETTTGIRLAPFGADFSEQIEAFRRTEPQHSKSYRKLAK